MMRSPAKKERYWARALRAIDGGDLKTISQLSQDHESILVECAPDDSGTLLHYAARKSKQKVVAFLLSRGADVNARDRDGETALFWAGTIASYSLRNTEILKTLKEHRADFNLTDWHGYCVLTYAVVRGAVDEVRRKRIQLLLELGADPRQRDLDGKQPIDYLGFSTDGGEWTPALPENVRERRKCELILRAEMNRRDVKLLLLVARRRQQQEAALTADNLAQNPGPAGARSKAHRPSPAAPPTEDGDVGEDEGNDEEEYQVVEAAVRLVGLEDMIMFQLCMMYI